MLMTLIDGIHSVIYIALMVFFSR